MQAHEAYSEQLPQSLWQCYCVCWDDGASDRLSPWDMVPASECPDQNSEDCLVLPLTSHLTSSIPPSLPPSLPPSPSPPPPPSLLPVLASRMLSLLSGSATESEAWGGEEERERIRQGLSVAMEMDEAAMFVDPVDVEALPTYSLAVPFPTHLSLIQDRLEQGFYRCATHLLCWLAETHRPKLSSSHT